MDVDSLEEEIENEGPKKFGGWFEKEFKCSSDNGRLLCRINGEAMKVPNSVKNAEFREGETEEMVKSVLKNHKVNKKAGFSYSLDGE